MVATRRHTKPVVIQFPKRAPRPRPTVVRARDEDEALDAISAFLDDKRHRIVVIEKTADGIFMRTVSRLEEPDDDEP